MRLRADWAVIDGVLVRGAGITIDGQGVVRQLETDAAPSADDAYYADAVVVPGATDACSLAGLLGDEAATLSTFAAALEGLAQLAHGSTAVLANRAEVFFAAAVRAGVTTLALPHLAPQGDAASAKKSPTFAQADALVTAAQAVGMRLVLLDTLSLRSKAGAGGPTLPAAQQACAHGNLEAALGHLEALVRRLYAFGNPRLSWGMLVARPAHFGADAFVAARLRLAHLPMVLLDMGERLAAPQLPHVGAHAPLLAQALACGALDGCCAVLREAPAPPLDANVVTGLVRTGMALLQAPPLTPSSLPHLASSLPPSSKPHSALPMHLAPPQPHAAGEALRRGTASGHHLVPAGHWRSSVMLGRGGALPPSRVAASALGLLGGTLRPNTWADYVVLRRADGQALPQDPAELTRMLHRETAVPVFRVMASYVAGRRIWRRRGAS